VAKLVRFGVSIEEDLLGAFDALIEAKGWANRSDALRGLIRERLLEAQVREDPQAEVVGTITLVYDHHHGDLANRLVELQHRHHLRIVSTLHVHIDEANCLEVLVVKGVNREVRRISDALIGTRGVQQGKLIIALGSTDYPGPAEALGSLESADESPASGRTHRHHDHDPHRSNDSRSGDRHEHDHGRHPGDDPRPGHGPEATTTPAD